MIKHFNKITFETEVKNAEGLVLVDFWAPWCGPCRMLAPVLDELDKEVADQALIGKVNIDDEPSLAAEFGVMSIPTLIAFKDGKPINKIVGLCRKDDLKKALGL
jgi:thioredoxin 1